MTNEEALDLIQKKIGCLTEDIDECQSMHCDDCKHNFIENDAAMVAILKVAAVLVIESQTAAVLTG